jgi:putative transcriptional regulator
MPFNPDRLKKIRIGRGLSQMKLAGIIGITQSQLSKIECGTSQPSVEVAYNIAVALGISINDLFISSEPTEHSTTKSTLPTAENTCIEILKDVATDIKKISNRIGQDDDFSQVNLNGSNGES